MLRAADIMSRNVVTVTPETTIEELGRLLIERNIGGAPVVDKDGKLAGIVTENDLISQNKRLHIPTVLRLFDAFIPLGASGKVEEEIRRMSAATVADICSRKVVSIVPDTPLDDIATIMAEKKVHLLPVIEEGRLVGIVGKMDIIKSTFGEADKQQP